MTGTGPEPGVSYAGGPVEFADASRREACRSLASYLGVTETRARNLLDDPDGYAAELRSRAGVSTDPADYGIRPDGSIAVSGMEALRRLERRFPGPSLLP